MTNVLFNIIISFGAAMGNPFTAAYANGSRSVLALAPNTSPAADKAATNNNVTSCATSPISMVYSSLANQLYNNDQEQLEGKDTSPDHRAETETKVPETSFDGEKIIAEARENAKRFSWKNLFKSLAMSSNMATTPISAVFMAQEAERATKSSETAIATSIDTAHSYSFIESMAKFFASATTTPVSAVLMAVQNERNNAKGGKVEAATKSTNVITATLDFLAGATTTPVSAVLMAEHNERMGLNKNTTKPAGLMTTFANIFAGATISQLSAVFMAELAAKSSNEEEQAVQLIIANISDSKANKETVSAPNYDAATEERIAKTWDCIWQKMCSDIDLNALNEEVFIQSPASNKAPFERYYKAA